MTYQEKVKEYMKSGDYSIVPFTLLFSVFSVLFYTLAFSGKSAYVGENFGATFFFSVTALLILGFSFAHLYYLKLVIVNIGFTKEDLRTYLNSDDNSLEQFITKLFFAPLFIFMTFLLESTHPVDQFSDLFFLLFASFVSSFLLVILFTDVICSLVYVLFYPLNENKTSDSEKQVVVPVPVNLADSNGLFRAEWDSLHALLHEAKRKDLLDLETEHYLNADIERVDKSVCLFENLSAEKQAMMQKELHVMFDQVEARIQEAIDWQDAQLIQEIKKQQFLLNK